MVIGQMRGTDNVRIRNLISPCVISSIRLLDSFPECLGIKEWSMGAFSDDFHLTPVAIPVGVLLGRNVV
jgi:hypothetical protein